MNNLDVTTTEILPSTMQHELDLSNENLAEFCRRWRVEELSLDRERHSPTADPGLRVKFDPSAEWSFAERLRMQREFQKLSGHEVRFKPTHARRRGGFARVLFNA